jgi:hypothetical protein
VIFFANYNFINRRPRTMPKSSTGQPGVQGGRPVTPPKPAPNNAAGHVSPQIAKNYRFTEANPRGGGFQGERPPQRIDGKKG